MCCAVREEPIARVVMIPDTSRVTKTIFQGLQDSLAFLFEKSFVSRHIPRSSSKAV